jgi:hypothetical protein
MEVLDGPNSDCVCNQYCLFMPQNDSSCCALANVVPGTILLPVGMLITGWTAQNRVFWLVPDVVRDLSCPFSMGVKCRLQGIALVGAGVVTTFQSIQTYVIDSFTLHAASGEIPV